MLFLITVKKIHVAGSGEVSCNIITDCTFYNISAFYLRSPKPEKNLLSLFTAVNHTCDATRCTRLNRLMDPLLLTLQL